MGSAMGSALRGVDVAVVADVYPARESPIPGVTGRLVADAAEGGRAKVHWVPARKELVARLAGLVEAGDLVVTMGAGDVTAVGSGLLEVLRRREGALV